MRKIRFTITIDEKVLDFCKDKASTQNRSVSAFIETTIRNHYKKGLKDNEK